MDVSGDYISCGPRRDEHPDPSPETFPETDPLDPWAELTARPHVTLAFADLDGNWGETLGATIYLAHGLSQDERRSTLAHELEHVAAGEEGAYEDAPDGYFTRKRERQCDREAARKLIPLRRLAEAARWARDHFELAAELRVDVDTLRTRLDYLHPSERAAIGRALDV